MELFHIPELIPGPEETTFFCAAEVQFMERIEFEPMHVKFQRRKRNAARRRVLQGIVTQEAAC
jgi:hypothetical protein